MIYLVDTNVILRILRRTDPNFPVVRVAVHTLWSDGHQLQATMQNFGDYKPKCDSLMRNPSLTLPTLHYAFLRLIHEIEFCNLLVTIALECACQSHTKLFPPPFPPSHNLSNPVKNMVIYIIRPSILWLVKALLFRYPHILRVATESKRWVLFLQFP